MVFQFHPRPLSDLEIARGVTPAERARGRVLAAIARTAWEHAAETGPCSFVAYEGPIAGVQIRVFVEEEEEGAKLGPHAATRSSPTRGQSSACLTPPSGRGPNGGVSRHLFLDAVSTLAAARIEEGGLQEARAHPGQDGEASRRHQPAHRRPRDAGHHGHRKKKVDVRGPVFFAARSEIA